MTKTMRETLISILKDFISCPFTSKPLPSAENISHIASKLLETSSMIRPIRKVEDYFSNEGSIVHSMCCNKDDFNSRVEQLQLLLLGIVMHYDKDEDFPLEEVLRFLERSVLVCGTDGSIRDNGSNSGIHNDAFPTGRSCIDVHSSGSNTSGTTSHVDCTLPLGIFESSSFRVELCEAFLSEKTIGSLEHRQTLLILIVNRLLYRYVIDCKNISSSLQQCLLSWILRDPPVDPLRYDKRCLVKCLDHALRTVESFRDYKSIMRLRLIVNTLQYICQGSLLIEVCF